MCPRLRDLIWQLRGLLTRIQSREGSTRGGAVSRETFRGLWNILGWTTFIQQGKNCIYGWEEQGAILAGGHGTGSLVAMLSAGAATFEIIKADIRSSHGKKELFFHHIITQYGIPRQVISDQDT